MKVKIIGNSMFHNNFENCGCDVVELYKPVGGFTKVFKKLDAKIRFMPSDFWLNDRLYPLCEEKCDVAIVFDFFTAREVLFHSIVDIVNAKRKIIYLWNAIDAPLENIPADWEIWTFDIGNAERFGYKYGGTFYPMENNVRNDGVYFIKYDVFFAGLDKGRRACIEELEMTFDKLGITYRMDLMSRSVRQLLFDRYVMYKPYAEIIKCIKQSRAILEISKKGQKGLTLRVLESLRYKKKLITNNSNIVRYKFYTPKNIFILGRDDMSALPSFINGPYLPIEFDTEEYDIARWLDRILADKQFTDERNGI